MVIRAQTVNTFVPPTTAEGMHYASSGCSCSAGAGAGAGPAAPGCAYIAPRPRGGATPRAPPPTSL